MGNTSMEAKNMYRQMRDVSKNRAYINIPIDVANSLENLDCISRSIWLKIFKIGYFHEGEATISLQDLADNLHVSRSCIEKKLNVLIGSGYIIKQNNFNPKNHQYMASTFFAVLPNDELEKIAKLPTRRGCFENAGKFVTEGLGRGNQNDVDQTESNAVITKIESLERAGISDVIARAQHLMLKAKLKSINDQAKKNLQENISTPSPTKKVRSPIGCEIYNNIKITDIKNNNMQNAVDKPSSICSSGSEKYKNTPVEVPSKIMDKIQKAVRDAKYIALPDEVIAEGEFAVARCFTGTTIDHAANVFCKLLREGRWTTPIPMRMKTQGEPRNLF